MSEQLEAMGIEADDHLVRFDEFLSVEATTPKFEGASRLMTELQFTAKISVRTYTYRDTASPVVAAAPTPGAPDATPAPTATPVPTATPAFRPMRRWIRPSP